MVKPSNQVKRLAAEKILSDLRDEGAKEKATILKGSQIKSNSFFATPSSLKPDTPEKESGSTEFIADGFSTILTTLSGIAKSLNKSSKLDKKENEIDRRKDNKFRKRAREAELEQKKENKEKSGIGKKIAGVGKGLFGSLSAFFGKILMGSSLLALLNYLKTGKGKFLAAGATLFGAAVFGPIIVSTLTSLLGLGALGRLGGNAAKLYKGGATVLKGRKGLRQTRTSVKGFKAIGLRSRDKFLNARKNFQRRGIKTLNPLSDDFLFRTGSTRERRRSAKVNKNFANTDKPNMRTLGKNKSSKIKVSGFDNITRADVGMFDPDDYKKVVKKSGTGKRLKTLPQIAKTKIKGLLPGTKIKGLLPGTNIKGLLPSGPPRLPGSGQLELLLGSPRKIVKKFSSPQGRLTGTKIKGLLPPVKKVGFLKGIASKAKSIFKIGGKGGAKSLFKKIPIVGLGLGTMFAVQRLMSGDTTGAGMELLSGIAGSIPGLGTAASLSIDAALMAKDMGAFDKKDDTVRKTTNARKKNFEELAKKRYSSTKITTIPMGMSGPMETFGGKGGSTYPAASSEGSQTEIPSSSSTSGVESNYTSSVYGLLGGSN